MLNGIDTFKQLSPVITWTLKKSNKAEFLDKRDFSFLREKFATFSSFKSLTDLFYLDLCLSDEKQIPRPRFTACILVN